MQNFPDENEPHQLKTDSPDGDTSKTGVNPLARAAMEEWRAKQAKPRRSTMPSAVAQREAYRLERGLEEVRSYEYHNHSPREPHETNSDYEKRLHRDRQRYYRGHSSETVRIWTDLSGMTPEEKDAHKRALAKERRRLQRFNERNDPGYRAPRQPLTEEQLLELDEALKNFSFD